MGAFFSRRNHDQNRENLPRDVHSSNDIDFVEPPRKRRRLSNENGSLISLDEEKNPGARKRNAKTRNEQNDTQINVIERDMDTKPHDIIRRKKRKVALFLGYVGEKYSGMQLNPGVTTIEEVLFKAFCDSGAISGSNKESLSKVHWMRAARTDKGVSAAVQCVSAKLECEVNKELDLSLVDAINTCLPDDITLYGMLRATGGFNARSDCQRRRYEYLFPVRLLGGVNGTEKEVQEGQGDPRVAKLTSILQLYEGTHCFANFTEGLESKDDASKRYMINVRCGQPFLPPNSGVYFVAVEIYGQSFLLHQIRKMVGLAIIVYLNHVPQEAIRVALCPHVKLPTPMAPALGLLLDNLTFDNYNKRFGQVLGTKVGIDPFQQNKAKFKHERIYKRIAEKERLDRVLETWFKTCHQKHQYQKDHILDLHSKFITTDTGKEEQRKAHQASLYQIRTNMSDFLDSEDNTMVQTAKNVLNQFEERFGRKPTFMARTPGKVVLIGEHLDYNGLPVITVALTQGTFAAGCLDDTDYVDVEHVESKTYAGCRFRVNGHRMALPEDQDTPNLDTNWLTYVSSGMKALVQHLPVNKRYVKGGGRLIIGGDLPKAAGLGSSSSLVTIAALSATRLNRKRIPKHDIALWSAEGERIGAGTKGGAVDHVTSMCGAKNLALRISFAPKLSVNEMKLPSGAVFIGVASEVKAKKGMNDFVRSEFNLRAAECRVGAAILARRLEVYLSKSVTTPGQLLYQAKKTRELHCNDMFALRAKARAVMSENEIMTLEEIRKELDVNEIELENRFLQGVAAKYFNVGKRLTHVLTEAERVIRFENILNNKGMSDVEKITELGTILNEGQKSLEMFFETSCKEVDELTEFCRRSGAVGSRMTGAGLGGFTINLVLDSQLANFMKAVSERVGNEAIMKITPSSGACIFAIHSPIRQQQDLEVRTENCNKPERKSN